MIFFAFVSCEKVEVKEKSNDAESLQAELERQKNSAIEEYILSLSECERLAQIFVVNIEGNEEFCFCEYADDDSEKKIALTSRRLHFLFI